MDAKDRVEPLLPRAMVKKEGVHSTWPHFPAKGLRIRLRVYQAPFTDLTQITIPYNPQLHLKDSSFDGIRILERKEEKGSE